MKSIRQYGFWIKLETHVFRILFLSGAEGQRPRTIEYSFGNNHSN